MKETINNIHVISKGVVVSLILHMITIGFLVITGFTASLELFTMIIFSVMAVSGFYVGAISERYAEINGLILSIFTSIIVLLYISQYTKMDWEVNRILIACYLVIGFLSALFSRLTNKKQKQKQKQNSNLKKEQQEENTEKGEPSKDKKNKPFLSFSKKKKNKIDRRQLAEQLKKEKEHK